MKKLLALGVASLLLAGCSSTGTALAPTPSPDTTTDTTQVVPTDSPMMTPEASPSTVAAVTMPDGSIQVQLAEQNTSGETGTATLTPSTDGKKVTVVLAIAGGTSTVAQPAHIHVGSCPTPGAVKYPLTDVVKGKSTTVLAVSLADLLKVSDHLSINVHKSASEISSYTACGDIQ